ncbi:MAG: hypothetical protein C4341_06360 [Armatimonadota bacterium]
MASEQSQYDLPIVVGAVVFGLIATAAFFFMRNEPSLPPQPAEPIRTPVAVQPVQPTMVNTSGPAGGGQTGGSTSGVGGGAGAAGGRRGPAIGGMTG